MIQFEKTTLTNGLRVIVHTDISTPFVAVNVCYNVGSKHEDQERTGFAHLFEHLTFGGSKHVPDFDTPVQNAGGTNNAFTSNDITNYYITIPANNIETALWLESDRMLGPKFTKKGLEVQRKVVIEEFRQTSLNKPYGDVWHLLRDLSYKEHPYRWMSSTSGLTAKALAMQSLCCCPPDKEKAESFSLSLTSSHNTTFFSNCSTFSVKRAAFFSPWMRGPYKIFSRMLLGKGLGF